METQGKPDKQPAMNSSQTQFPCGSQWQQDPQSVRQQETMIYAHSCAMDGLLKPENSGLT